MICLNSLYVDLKALFISIYINIMYTVMVK